MGKIKIKRSGLMLIVSSPSGAGKTSLARKLIEIDNNIKLSISVTTRQARVGEKEGEDYFFVSNEDFDKMIVNNKFLEHAKVFNNRYGTLREPLMTNINAGKDILFDIDWQGTQALREVEAQHIVSVFILPPSTKELENRLMQRGQDMLDEVNKRMSAATAEITHWAEYDYVIINHDLEESLSDIRAILDAERLKRDRQIGLSDFVRNIIKE